jgi:hypothetical protein
MIESGTGSPVNAGGAWHPAHLAWNKEAPFGDSAAASSGEGNDDASEST